MILYRELRNAGEERIVDIGTTILPIESSSLHSRIRILCLFELVSYA